MSGKLVSSHSLNLPYPLSITLTDKQSKKKKKKERKEKEKEINILPEGSYRYFKYSFRDRDSSRRYIFYMQHILVMNNI